MFKLRHALLAISMLAPVPALAHSAPAAATSVAPSEHDRMFALFAAADEAQLKRNPPSALFRGDMRYADRLGDYLTPAFNDASRAAATGELAELRKIDRAKLSPTDRIAWEIGRAHV